MESSESSSPSASPPQSPAASYHAPTLERLVFHLVTAKNSLAATTNVYRANELVTTSRSLVEEIAILNAKNAFARRGLDEQADTLETIKDAIVEDADKVATDFSETVASLDKAHHRLEKTLKTLRKTVVHAKSRHPNESHSTESGAETAESKQDDDEEKTLYDFIDETTHEDLVRSLRHLIDSYHTAREDLDGTLTDFETSIKSITDKFQDTPDSSGPPDKPTIYDEPPPSIQQLFRSMEEHATEMASQLENLIEHYDKCVTAIKHTEGGGEAAKNALQSAELTKNQASGVEESLYLRTETDPIPEEEREEMLRVIEEDAQQVEEVVVEIRDYASEMESSFQKLSKHSRNARLRNKTLREVLNLMREIRAAIPGYLEAAATFRDTWHGISVDMQSKTKELAELSVFYEQFLSGYGKLLREVERRKASEAQMRKIAEKARRDLERLYDADSVARGEFMEEVGHFLPRDLGAWHGFEDDPTRWEIHAVASGEQDDYTSRLRDG